MERKFSKAVNIPENGALKRKLSGALPITVVFLGGSVTAGFDGSGNLSEHYPVLTERYLKKKYPDRKISCVNLARSAYMSAMGLIEYIAKAESLQPDIVFLEFAVNDTFDRFNAENFESLVRRILRQKNDPAVIVINCCLSDKSSCEAYMNEIAELYRLPSASIKSALPFWGGWDNYSADGIHPTADGHRLIFSLIKDIFENAPCADIYHHSGCCYGNSLEGLRLLNGMGAAQISEGDFKLCGICGFESAFSHRTGAAPLSFKLSAGDNCGILSIVYIINSDPALYGRADISVNGRLCAVLDGYSIFGWDNPICFTAAFEGGCDITVTVSMHKGDESKRFDILAFGI